MRRLFLLFALVCAARAAMWLDVPFVRQEKNGCGAAVLAMVIGYWQQHGAAVPAGAADAPAIQKELYSPKAEGIYASELSAYLERTGFRAFPFRADWSDLQNHLEKGRPIILSLGHSRLHYVVAAGMDAEHGLLYVNDPAERKLMKLDRASFERAWNDHWALLAVPRQNQ